MRKPTSAPQASSSPSPPDPEDSNAARLSFPIRPQPDDTTCGPTSLHAVYSYFDDAIPLEQVIEQVPTLETGGTLASLLGQHALSRGYEVTIYTCNLQVFDPTWFASNEISVVEKLRAQMRLKHSKRLRAASRGYIDFLNAGGRIRLEDISADLIRNWLQRGVPIITGLSLTWLYRDPREVFSEDGPARSDDVAGEPVGHFVVLYGYDPERQKVCVADPYEENPHAVGRHYEVSLERVLCAVLLGIVTYDANLLIIQPQN